MKEFLYKIISLFFKSINKKIIILSNKEINQDKLFAVKTNFGFWYVGDIFDRADIAYGLISNGLVEKYETELVISILNSILKHNDRIIFYDVGANTGYYGILAAMIGNSRVNVFSFEPVKEHVDKLNESLKLNDLENKITVFSMALSNEDGERQIFLSGSGSTIVKGFMNVAEDNYRNVVIKKLDNLILANNMDLPDFIKIDIEGAEYNMLCGSKDVIAKSRPIIFVEIIAYAQNGKQIFNYTQSSSATLDLLRNDFGYMVFCLVENKLHKVDKNWDVDGAKMYLCLDRSKHGNLINELCL